MQFSSIEGVVNCTSNVKQIILLLLMLPTSMVVWKRLKHRFDNIIWCFLTGSCLLILLVVCLMFLANFQMHIWCTSIRHLWFAKLVWRNSSLSGTSLWIGDRQTEIGIFVTRDLNQCATTGCLISHDREDLNTAKNILSSRVKNGQSHSREIRRKKSW